MEAKTNVPQRTKPQNDDIDLGHLFDKTGGAIVSFFTWVDTIFSRLGDALLQLLFLLRRNAIWLLAGTLIGVGIGIYFQSKEGARYSSTMTVRANFNSTLSLYNSLDYFNALIANRETGQLVKLFNISPAEASSLKMFEATPVKSEKIVSDMYNEQFMRQEKDAVKRMDTFWTKTIPYKDFKSSLTKYDYPLHDITVISSNVMIFQKLQQGILNEINSNKLLQDIKNTELNINKDEVEILTSSIKSIDTLRSVYYKRLSAVKSGEQGNNLTLMEGGFKTQAPELELYDKLLDLKNELKSVKTNSVLETDILLAYTSFGKIGQKESFLKQTIARWSLIGLLTSLCIILLISLYKNLKDFETRYNKKQAMSRS
ncbi:MAG TPA: hypothetical protein VM101_02325 [Flavitalea sp.]|nr:hypothetical protein [Flavitalea sp.]